MFDRLKRFSVNLVRLVRTALIAGLAVVVGCDRSVAWRGVGTDARDGDEKPRRDTPERSSSDVLSP
jgi:hypothetical protein